VCVAGCVAGCVAVCDTVGGERAVQCVAAGAYGNQLQCVAVCVAARVAVSIAAGRRLAAGAYGSQLHCVAVCDAVCVAVWCSWRRESGGILQLHRRMIVECIVESS